jgi:hypothetical protein
LNSFHAQVVDVDDHHVDIITLQDAQSFWTTLSKVDYAFLGTDALGQR